MDDRRNPAHPRHRELMLPCCSSVRKAVDCAALGDMIDPATLPASVRREGGGWIGRRYVCSGTHKDGTSGFKLTEIR